MSFDVSRLTVTSQCFSSLSAKFEIYAIESYSRIKFVKKVVGLQFSLFYKLSGINVSTKGGITPENQRWQCFYPIPFSPQ